MENFSQRIGKTPRKTVLQLEDMDIDLRNGLWNALHIFYWERLENGNYRYLSQVPDLKLLMRAVWVDLYKIPLDTLPDFWESAKKVIKEKFYQTDWVGAYDLVEFIANNYSGGAHNHKFMTYCNEQLEKEVSGYRFLNGKLTPISHQKEKEEIEKALDSCASEPFFNVHEHISCAIDLFSNRQTPDYRNSIKESISAVEAVCQTISGKPKATLGDALNILEKKRKLHQALKNAFSSLYGYTNDAEGIRHALLDESNLDSNDARFMLVSCSSFINYLISKSTSGKK